MHLCQFGLVFFKQQLTNEELVLQVQLLRNFSSCDLKSTLRATMNLLFLSREVDVTKCLPA